MTDLFSHTPLDLTPVGVSKSGYATFAARDEDIVFYCNGRELVRFTTEDVTDLTSWPKFVRKLSWVPVFGRWLADRDFKYSACAVFHDALLLHRRDLGKDQIDGLYLLFLRQKGVSATEATTFYLAVRTKP